MGKLAPVFLDRSKMHLALLSLINQARTETVDHAQNTVTLVFRTSMSESIVCLEIMIEGLLLQGDDLETLFHQGRLTAEGVNNGFHYTANAVHEMNGQIEALCHTDPPGLGIYIRFPVAR